MTPNLRAKFSLYEIDYLAWIETTVNQLEQQNLAQVDWENLIEELKDMGRSERRRLRSNLVVVLLHLLKWQYQPTMRSRSWRSSITEHRRRIREALEDSPSLQPYLHASLSQCYADAIRLASDETGLSISAFAAECPYSISQTLDMDFLPE
jgi:hypothetical protein